MSVIHRAERQVHASHFKLMELLLQEANQSNLEELSNRFRFLTRYCQTRNFAFSMLFGSWESAHQDSDCYQAIAVIQTKGWCLKGASQSSKSTWQETGDLIVLDQSRKHEVVWDRHFSRPTQPWVYLAIDWGQREKWSKKQVTKYQAIALAEQAIAELNDPVNISFLSAGQSAEEKLRKRLMQQDEEERKCNA